MTSPRHQAERHTCFRCRVLAGLLVVIAVEFGILAGLVWWGTR